jgi:HAD superfamily hydrolase (TIGR01509 family)
MRSDVFMLLHKSAAVIFDMDGLMLDTESIYHVAWQRAASELGYDMSDEMYVQFVGRPINECTSMLMDIYGDQFPLDAFLKRGADICRQHIATYGIAYKPGLGELLDFLERIPMRLAVATSSNRRHTLHCLGDLAQRFEVIVTGDEVAQGKPAPDIYMLAAQRLNVLPAECLVLEDSAAGVQAAHAALMRVILVPDLKPPSAQASTQATCICASLHEVRALLQAWV